MMDIGHLLEQCILQQHFRMRLPRYHQGIPAMLCPRDLRQRMIFRPVCSAIHPLRPMLAGRLRRHTRINRRLFGQGHMVAHHPLRIRLRLGRLLGLKDHQLTTWDNGHLQAIRIGLGTQTTVEEHMLRCRLELGAHLKSLTSRSSHSTSKAEGQKFEQHFKSLITSCRPGIGMHERRRIPCEIVLSIA